MHIRRGPVYSPFANSVKICAMMVWPLFLQRRQFKENSILLAFKVNFYAPPQKVAGYFVIPSAVLSVCPSICQRVIIRVRSITLIPFEIISRNLAQKYSMTGDVQRLTTVTPSTFFAELLPLVIFSIEIMSAL